MSDPGQPSPDRPGQPAKKGSGFDNIARVVLILLAVGVGATVLVFGTCLLMIAL
jgi:hypothetical protein